MLFSPDHTVRTATLIAWFCMLKITQAVFFGLSSWDAGFYPSKLGTLQRSLVRGGYQRWPGEYRKARSSKGYRLILILF